MLWEPESADPQGHGEEMHIRMCLSIPLPKMYEPETSDIDRGMGFVALHIGMW